MLPRYFSVSPIVMNNTINKLINTHPTTNKTTSGTRKSCESNPGNIYSFKEITERNELLDINRKENFEPLDGEEVLQKF